MMGFSQTSTLVGHFVLSPRAREKRDRKDRGSEREGQEGTGMKLKKQKKPEMCHYEKHPYSNI